jgi:pimeloyl-ACP methyl ester carboxylesterase
MALARWMTDFGELPAVESRWAQVEGHRMHYLKAGQGPELLLLHGLLGTAGTWEPALPYLTTDSTIYAPDALCIGKSERVAQIDPGVEAQADRLSIFMREAGIASADVLATSHGGAVAMMLAARHPGKVRSLVLHAPVNPFCNLSDPLIHFYQSGLGRWFAHRIPTLPESMQELALGRMYGNANQIREGSREKYFGSLCVPGTIDYLLSLLGNWSDDMRRLESVLESIRNFPSLLLWGDRDRTVGLASGYRLQHCLVRSSLVVLPGAGHLPFEECPEIFATAVNSFLGPQRSQREPGPKLVIREPSAGDQGGIA